MRLSWLSIVIVTILVLSSCETMKNDGFAPISNQNQNFLYKTDPFTEITIIENKFYHKLGYNYPVKISIVESNQKTNISLSITYINTDWIFLDKVYLANDANQKMEISIESNQVDREVLSPSMIQEHFKYILSEEELYKIKEIVQSSIVTIRYSGKYYEDRVLPKDYITAINDTLFFYIAESKK